ncbi:hypothetical protein DENSPDRAFT_871795 [Dentipellis sp. KUC8613]|nr:hypothetical protein DENSPDRAFT_871795 [Dentipellis sp. KUC8613]
MLRYILLPALMALNLGGTARGAPAPTPHALAARHPAPVPMPFLHPAPISRRSSPVHLTSVPANELGHKRGMSAVPTIPMGPDPEADVPAALKSRQMDRNHDWAGHPQGATLAPETQPDPPAEAKAPATKAKREDAAPADKPAPGPGGVPKLNTKDPVQAQINGNSIPPKLPGGA